MARRRPPPEELDALDLEQPPPNHLARAVWVHRWGQEHRGPLPENRVQSWRTIFNAAPLEPNLERVRAHRAELSDDQRRRCWEDDDDRPGPECAPCPHHADQAVALCPQECPTVARLQRRYDAANRHYWEPGAQ